MAAAVFATLVTAILGHSILALPLLALTLLIGHFFRDPHRIAMPGPSDILSPADGNVIAIKRIDSAHFNARPCWKISIFMSIFDVHVNRIPFSGVIQGVYYKKGRFMAANFAGASVENEQNWLWIRTESGHDIEITQVAGLIARRIVCWPEVGDQVVRGERLGMIRFGSRMDVYVPENSEIVATQGMHVYRGETILCRLK